MEWLTRFSSETSSKCSGIDLDGLWSISAKEKPGRRRHLTCLEVDQLLERTTSLIPGILQELGVADPGLGGGIEGAELRRYSRLDVPRYSRGTAGTCTAGTAGTARNALTEAWAEVHQRYISGTAGTAGTADGTA